jgi:hypothetical protein
MENSKPCKIPKQTVMAAYKKVKANKGRAGVKGQGESLENTQKNRQQD